MVWCDNDSMIVERRELREGFVLHYTKCIFVTLPPLFSHSQDLLQVNTASLYQCLLTSIIQVCKWYVIYVFVASVLCMCIAVCVCVRVVVCGCCVGVWLVVCECVCAQCVCGVHAVWVHCLSVGQLFH